MAVTKITDENIVDVDASKLVGSFGAVDGSNLTNLPLGKSVTKTTSDPTQETNPADGVGALHLNTSSGELFCCVDATTDVNVWKNTGLGTTGTIEPVVAWSFQGTQYGYAAGGMSADYARYDDIERFSFVSDNTMGDVGSLTAQIAGMTGHSSMDYGYVAGGYYGTPSTPSGSIKTIQKFSYATQADAVDTGAELMSSNGTAGNSAAAGFGNETHGYVHCGHKQTPNENWDVIQKFPYASSSNSTQIGNCAYPSGVYQHTGWSSPTHGYSAGGYNYGGGFEQISDVEKMAFASEGNSVKCGDLSQVVSYTTSSNSTTHGYIQGGFITGWATTENIEKFSFASEGTATTPAILMSDITHATGGGTSSNTHGYTAGGMSSGGQWAGGAYIAIVQKHSHITDSDATQCGDLNYARGYAVGGIQI